MSFHDAARLVAVDEPALLTVVENLATGDLLATAPTSGDTAPGLLDPQHVVMRGLADLRRMAGAVLAGPVGDRQRDVRIAAHAVLVVGSFFDVVGEAAKRHPLPGIRWAAGDRVRVAHKGRQTVSREAAARLDRLERDRQMRLDQQERERQIRLIREAERLASGGVLPPQRHAAPERRSVSLLAQPLGLDGRPLGLTHSVDLDPWQRHAHNLIGDLLRLDVPAPSAARPHERLLDDLSALYNAMGRTVLDFLEGLEEWDNLTAIDRRSAERVFGVDVPARAQVQYEDDLIRLAAQSPEMLVWTTLH
jgi:hypothetical protein